MSRCYTGRFLLLLTLSSGLSANAFADMKVIDQDGRSRDFFDDVVGEKKAIVNFIYTHCEGVCPRSGQHFGLLQKKLGKRLVDEVVLISITIDPDRDKPLDLKHWQEIYKQGPGWTVVTADRETIAAISLKLLGSAIQKDGHSPFVALKNPGEEWQRLYGLANPNSIIARLDAPSASSKDTP